MLFDGAKRDRDPYDGDMGYAKTYYPNKVLDTRAASALGYLARATVQPYGNAFMDNDSLVSDGSQRVCAFTSFPEIEARFTSGQAASALDEIGRLYGWMNSHDPAAPTGRASAPVARCTKAPTRPRRTAGRPGRPQADQRPVTAGAAIVVDGRGAWTGAPRSPSTRASGSQGAAYGASKANGYVTLHAVPGGPSTTITVLGRG